MVQQKVNATRPPRATLQIQNPHVVDNTMFLVSCKSNKISIGKGTSRFNIVFGFRRFKHAGRSQIVKEEPSMEILARSARENVHSPRFWKKEKRINSRSFRRFLASHVMEVPKGPRFSENL
jgi:hypothetical protein